jgi:hypothetical protein
LTTESAYTNMPNKDADPKPRSTIISLRLTDYEDAAVRRAAAVMTVTVSQLVEVAATEAAHRLGFFMGPDAPIRGKRIWPDAPERGDSSTSRRISVTMSILTHELTTRAADYVHVSHPFFLIGATLRYIATRKKFEPKNKELVRIELPAQYD